MTITNAFDAAVQRHKAGMLNNAKALYEQVLAAQPRHSDALHLLGLIENQQGKPGLATQLIRRAIAINAAPPYHFSLGEVLFEQGDNLGALEAYQSAVSLAPNFARAHAGIGNALFQQGNLEPACDAYRRALALREDLAGVHSNLGLALADLGQLEIAMKHYRRAIELNPDSADAHNNISLALLLQGQFAEGWMHHEWRWRVQGLPIGVRHFERPPWRGEPLNEARILLHAEQGAGDTVQFVRYAPLVVARGGRVLLEVQPELKRFMLTMSGVEQVISRGDPIPVFTRHCPLLSLPLVFGTELDTIPSEVPYLRPDANELENWNARFRIFPGLHVGLVWGGRPEHRVDRKRSIPLAAFAPLATVDNVVYFSLQKGPAAAQITEPPAGLVLHDIAADLNDFADTAAAIAALDLVITVDTSVAHVAGALGKRVWILLPHVPDWRWLLDREDSPWYPTARLFRQPMAGAWASVFERVVEELRRLTTEIS
jgi:Tfp pilus assembly protein PilF